MLQLGLLGCKKPTRCGNCTDELGLGPLTRKLDLIDDSLKENVLAEIDCEIILEFIVCQHAALFEPGVFRALPLQLLLLSQIEFLLILLLLPALLKLT